MSILWSSMIFPARNLGFDGFPMAHRVAEVVATEVTQNTGATFPWLGFFPLFFWKKLGFDGCWIWTNMGLKVRFYVEFDIYVIIIYMCVCVYVYVYIYIHMEAERIWQISSRRVLTVSSGMDPVSHGTFQINHCGLASHICSMFLYTLQRQIYFCNGL